MPNENVTLTPSTLPPHTFGVSTVNVTCKGDDILKVEPPAAPETDNPDHVTIKLQTPLSVNGKDITEITLNFAKLTAKDHINLEEEMVQAELTVMKNVAFSTTYCLYIASRACGINIGDLERLGFKDANAVIKATRNFMRDSE